MEIKDNQPEQTAVGLQEQRELTATIKSLAQFVWDLVKVFAFAFVLVWLIIRPFIAEPFVVSGSSMVPNFTNRDYLIVEKLSYRFHPPSRGDIIVFRYPLDPKQYFIKRIIGLPGEKVQISGGRVTIYNQAVPTGFILKENYLPESLSTLGSPGAPGTVALREGQYFMMGDNRSHSSDSRAWGILPKADIIGRAWLRVLPLSDLGVIHHYSFGQ